MVECKICNKKFKRIQWTHLKAHGLTVNEYKMKYPSAPLVDESVQRLMSCTRENMIRRYGEDEGTRRWDLYRHKQAVTNTFEYKQEVYGWTIDQFNEYNKSRGHYGSNNGNYGIGYYQVWVEKYGREVADEMNREASSWPIKWQLSSG